VNAEVALDGPLHQPGDRGWRLGLATAVVEHVPRPVLVYLLNGSLLLVDFMFLAANTTKLFEGGWLPLLIAP
jgi:K+ transporter